MKLPLILCLLCLAAVLAGCSVLMPEYKKVALLHVGMTRQEVVDSLGEPVKTTKHGAIEVMSYSLADSRSSLRRRAPKTGYYIVIGRGRVEAFGRE
jgi:hypothetical protein